MAENKLITKIKFEPCVQRKSLVGFVDFVYQDKFSFTDVAVHIRLDKKSYRLRYSSETYPINTETQRQIDKIISEHITQQGESNGNNEKNPYDTERIY